MTNANNPNFISAHQLHEFDNLEVLANQVVEGFIIGLHKSPFHGFSVEFAEHRLYNPGDAIKDIDWKVYARTDKLFIKRFEEETNLRCRLVIDASSSMYFPENAGAGAGYPPINKLQFAAVSAAVLMRMIKKQRDAVGLTIFENEVEFNTRTRSTTTHHNLIMNKLHELILRKERSRNTAVAKCLHQIADDVHRRSMVIIFSDMLDNKAQLDDIFGALQHLKYNKHEVILFHVADYKHELNFEFENRPYEFIDMETNEKVKLQPAQIKDFYKNYMQNFMKELKLKCAQYQIDFVQADINQPYSQILLPYLLKRSKMAV